MKKIEDLEKTVLKLCEKMERLETALIRLDIHTRDYPPPLPPRSKNIQQQAPPITHEVSLQISPGLLIPVKSTDL